MHSRLIATVAALSIVTSAAVAAKAYPEFGGRCAMGVAMGDNVPTDCSLRWTGPDGNLYCFGSKEGQEAFMKDPDSNLEKAFQNYEDVTGEKPATS